MPYNLRPSEFPEGGMTPFVHKDPAVLPGTNGVPPILRGSPPAGFPWVAAFHGALRAIIHEVVEVCEDLRRHPRTEVVTPASDHRIHRVDQRHRGGAHVATPESFQFPFDLRDRACARCDQELIAAA